MNKRIISTILAFMMTVPAFHHWQFHLLKLTLMQLKLKQIM